MRDRLPSLRMERFARYVVAGGLALVAGLWAAELAAFGTVPWAAGILLAAFGIAGLSAGIHSELDY